MNSHRTRARTLSAGLATMLALLVCAPAALADNLLVLNGDPPVTLSGVNNYGLVYVDGTMRLIGDTQINASSIYFGPHAQLQTCYVPGTGPGTGTNACQYGRSLALASPGQITVSSGLDLTGQTGTPQPAGSLSISGGQVAIGGDIDTTGANLGSSGVIVIASTGSVTVGGLRSPGKTVSISAGGGIDIAGSIQTAGTANQPSDDPNRAQSAATVTVASGGGDVRIDGSIDASGRDAAANAGAGAGGGNGGAVALTGTNVTVGSIDTTGGQSGDQSAGASAPITLNARGTLSVLGTLNAGGANAPKSAASGGAPIAATAAGSLVIGGGVLTAGAQGVTGGTGGGPIALQGATIDAGNMDVSGGDGPNNGSAANASPGNTVNVTANGHASVGAIDAGGGNAAAGGGPGLGGSITVRSNTDAVATGQLSTRGGSTAAGNGAAGGPISLSAQTNLTVASVLDTSGANGNGNANPPFAGGGAGAVLLRAATGTLTLGGAVRARGGAGGGNSVNDTPGGPGAPGGRIDIVAHTLGSISSVDSEGGDGGGGSGAGGPGGPIFGWTDGPLFDDLKVVSADGGSGKPAGPAGARTPEMSPMGITVDPIKSQLSFSSRSPFATGYQVIASVNGAAGTVVATTPSTTGIPVVLPICTPVTFTVLALAPLVGWTSDTAPVVTALRPPSPTQTCATAPIIKAAKPGLTFSVKALRHLHFKATLKLTTTGIGPLAAALQSTVKKKGHKPTVKTVLSLIKPLTAPGGVHLNIVFPLGTRHVGTYALVVITASPDGTQHTKVSLPVKVGK